jgi:hypothetical protein
MGSKGKVPRGADPCFCGDYRSQHRHGPSETWCFCGCMAFHFTRRANAEEIAHWNQYHAAREAGPARGKRKP